MSIDDPINAYRARIAAGEIHSDPGQEHVVDRLQSLHSALLEIREPVPVLQRLCRLLATDRQTSNGPKGLYIHGPPGRGKSMLMDLLFDTAPFERKRRVHFHAFMIEVHDAIHLWRKNNRKKHSGDPIGLFAASLANSTWLLCFDEFHVTDIADAMILGRLFEALFAHGVIIVTTSNWPLDNLYLGGLQRELFLPFIALFKKKLDLLELSGSTDYRLARLKAMRIYTIPLGANSTAVLEEDFNQLTHGAVVEPDRIEVKGRILEVSRAARGVAWMHFADLCEQPLGAEDYLAVARRYHTLVMDGVPRMDAANRNEAKRFMTLIDALYEAKVHLIVAAEAVPDQIYTIGSYSFEFQRTASRLMEMQSPEYLETPHRYGVVVSMS